MMPAPGMFTGRTFASPGRFSSMNGAMRRAHVSKPPPGEAGMTSSMSWLGKSPQSAAALADPAGAVVGAPPALAGGATDADGDAPEHPARMPVMASARPVRALTPEGRLMTLLLVPRDESMSDPGWLDDGRTTTIVVNRSPLWNFGLHARAG